MAKKRNIKFNNRDIIQEVNHIVRKFEDIMTREDQVWLQDKLDESLQNLLRKQTIGTEALSEFLFQKKPPHNLESETALLGRLILYPATVAPLCNPITPEHFYDVRNAIIFSICREIQQNNKQITLDAVYAYLEANKKTEAAGGKRYVEAIVNDCTSTEGISDRIKEVQDYYVLRGIWEKCADTVHNVMDVKHDNAHQFRLELIEDLSKLSNHQQYKYHDGATLAVQMAEYIEKYKEASLESGIIGLESCVSELDLITKGWNPTDLIIIAGRPGMGKTALAISDAAHSVVNGEPIAFFSLEMSAMQLILRMFCIIKNYNLYTAVHYKESELMTFISEELPNYPVYIDDTPGVNWKYILDKSLAMKQKHGIKKIYVDYIQLMSGIDPRITNRENIVGENSRGLKIVAKSTDCPVFALSQLSRSCETRIDKRPLLSDLRDSGSIEQDADIVIFTYRAEYYKIFEDDFGSTEGIAELIIAKHRNGELNTVKAFFNAPITKWTSLKNRPMTYTNKTNQNIKKSEVEVEEDFEDYPF